MTYKEDKRTKNLSLHDIHVGDWVQAWDNITKRHTPPERITAIFDDGTVYTEIDPEQGDPFEYDISEIDGLPITTELLIGFGIKDMENVTFYGNPVSLVVVSGLRYNKKQISFAGRVQGCVYMHEFQHFMRNLDDSKKTFNLQWRGV